jgi:hypothetical protein
VDEEEGGLVMNRRLALTLALCSTLALFAAAPGSGGAAEPVPVPSPVTDTGPSGPNPSPQPIDVVVCPAPCVECGQPGIICCLPNYQCIVLWWPIWFGAPGDALDGAGVLAPLRACSASGATADAGR